MSATLPDQLLGEIARSPKWRRQRIEFIATPQGPVLVKGQRPPHGAWRYRLLGGLAALSGSRVLRPVPLHGGARGQQIEARLLGELARAGVPVPRVLHEAKDHLVLQALSRSPLLEQLKKPYPQALAAWRMGLDAIADVHARGCCLSQAFARNLLLHEGRVWFIDFEDDPLEVMDLPRAQARDWLAYAHSSVWLMLESGQGGQGSRGVPADLVAHWAAVAEAESPPVRALLEQAARRLGWLRHLPGRRKPWGRDVVSARGAGVLLHAWRTARPGR